MATDWVSPLPAIVRSNLNSPSTWIQRHWRATSNDSAVAFAWVRLLQCEAINDANIRAAPLRVVAAVLQAAASGEENAERLADAAVRDWNPFGAKPN
jgi:hypothetical protein